MRRSRKKQLLIITLLFMVIGFATASTVVYLNGAIKIGINNEDFKVYFKSAERLL